MISYKEENDEINRACDLIFECIEMNQINIPIATAACTKVVMSIFAAQDIPKKQIDIYLDGFKKYYLKMKNHEKRLS